MSTSLMDTLDSSISSVIEEVEIINMMRDMTVNCSIPLEKVHCTYPTETKLYRGRPEMTVMMMSNGRNMQMFRGGKVQILGPVSDADVENMRHEFITKLRKISAMENFQVTKTTLLNLVMSVQLKKALHLHNITLTNSNVFHETELFPAALIRMWHPVHIAAFHSGKLIFTGLKSVEQLYNMLPLILSYLEKLGVLKEK